jgi:anti-anti-sigma factor
MLKVHTKNVANIAVLCLQGQIVTGETEVLRKVVLSQPHVSAVVLDFARVSTIDAGGLGVLLDLRAQTQSKGVEFRLSNVRSAARRILEITRLDSVFEISYANEPLTTASRRGSAAPWELAACA